MSDNESSVEILAQKERKRLLRVLGISLLLAIVVVGALVYTIKNSDTMFRPKLDIADGEKNLLVETNDPQCRGIIDSTTQLGIEFRALQDELAEKLITGSEEEVRPLLEKILALKLRAKDIHNTVLQAQFRDFETLTAKGVEDELHAWFKNLDLHFFFLERLANEHLEELELQKKTEGTVVSNKKKKKYKKTPKQRLDGALLNIDEAFQNFRVWHTGSLHPCGAASKDETPWSPDKKTGEKTDKKANTKMNEKQQDRTKKE